MLIKKIEIKNYKSLGEKKNILFVEDNVTTIIGKNGSGKSNILRAIKQINLYSGINKDIFDIKFKNRNSNNDIKLLIEMEFIKDEIDDLNVCNKKTIIEFSKEEIKISGGLEYYIINDYRIKELMVELIEILNQNPFPFKYIDRHRIIALIEDIKNINKISYSNFFSRINEVLQWTKYIPSENENIKKRIIYLCNKVMTLQDEIKKLLPNIHIVLGSYLFDTYTLKDIEDTSKNTDGLSSVLKVAQIEEVEFKDMLRLPEGGTKETIIDKMQYKIDKNINEEFSKFYKTEKINLVMKVHGNSIRFFIKSNGLAIELGERSEGLRWYLGLFINILSNNLLGKKTVFLFDEPGVHLHVLAQKELIKLFDELCSKGNQVIYTTHLPSMINANNILNIRAIQKDDDGNTKIYKSVYDSELSTKSKLETLTPLIDAIGMGLKYEIGPTYDKLNIITEGITDYMYIKAMMNVFNIDESKYYIIPASGASAIIHISSIFLGWGIKFEVLFDFDTEGVKEAEKVQDKLQMKIGDNIHFVIDVDNNDIKEKLYKGEKKTTIEGLLSQSDLISIENEFEDDKVSKTLKAKKFYDSIVNRTMNVDEITKDRFRNLFYRLGLK